MTALTTPQNNALGYELVLEGFNAFKDCGDRVREVTRRSGGRVLASWSTTAEELKQS